MNFENVKLILKSIRKELPNREAYLNHLKELTEHKERMSTQAVFQKKLMNLMNLLIVKCLQILKKKSF
jgi:hypothetical protein